MFLRGKLIRVYIPPKKLHKFKAFKNAQNIVKNKYPEPSYWAGFVMLDLREKIGEFI